MKLLTLTLTALLTGCSTVKEWTQPATPEEQAARAERDRERRVTEEQRRSEQQRRDTERRLADEKRQAENEQRAQHEQLRNRFKRYTTAELKVMHGRYANLAGLNTSKDIGLAPAASAIWGNPDRRNTEMLIDIERELLRRWKAGDSEAKLPHFE
jgi:hypothetical protein